MKPETLSENQTFKQRMIFTLAIKISLNIVVVVVVVLLLLLIYIEPD